MTTHKINIVVTAKDLATGPFKAIGKAMGGIGKIAGGILAAGGIKAIGQQIVAFGKTAGDITDVSQAFEGLAHSVGTSSSAMLKELRTASKGMISDLDLMKTSNEAILLTSGALSKDLPQYFAIASAAARASGKDFQFLFDSLVRGVARGTPMVIDNALITLDAAGAMETYAAKIGKTVDQLNKQEQQQATNEAVLSAGAAMMAKVGDSSASLSMQFAQLRVRGENLANSLAAKLAPAFSVVMDGLINTADTAETAGNAFIAKYGAKINEAAEKALRWGVNISVQLATGIVQGASSALVQAMQFIGSMLTNWMAPGSPPKLAPRIDEWGAAAMGQYLKGFTEADYSALDAVQGPLQSALSSLVDLGQMSSEAMGPLFASLSTDLAKAFSTGSAPAALFDTLRNKAGAFGEHLVQLVRGQLSLAKATRALQAAQERLNQARKKEDESLGTIKKMKGEYFALRKAGASEAQLQAKVKEIKAEQDRLRLAREEKAAAEEAETAAQKKLDPIAKQVHLQEQMIAQLAEIARAQAKMADMGGVGAGAGGGALGGALGGLGALPGMPAGGLANSLASAFGDAKAAIAEKLKDIFKPFADAWENDMKPALDAVKTQWGIFVGILTDFWNSPIMDGIREKFADLFPEGTLTQMGKIIGIGLVLALVFGIIFAALTVLFSPIVLLGIAIATLAALWVTHGEEIKKTWDQLAFIILAKTVEITAGYNTSIEAWQDVTSKVGIILIRSWMWAWKKIKLAFTKTWTAIKKWWDEKWPVFKKSWDEFWSGIGKKVSGVWSDITTTVKGAIGSIKGWLQGLVDKWNAMSIPSWLQGHSPPPMANWFNDIAESMNNAAGARMPRFNSGISGAGFAAATGGTGGGVGGVSVVVQGNVLDDRTAQMIADKVARVQRRRGIRRY